MSSSTPERIKKPRSPRERRLQEIWKKLENDEILRKIPARINPNMVFSEDEDESNSSFSDSGNTMTPKFPGFDSTSTRMSLSLEDLSIRSKTNTSKRNPLSDLPVPKKKPLPVTKPMSQKGSGDHDKIYTETLAKIAQRRAKRNIPKESFHAAANVDTFRIHEVKTNESETFTDVSNKKTFDSCSNICIDFKSANYQNIVVNRKSYDILSYLGCGGSCNVYSAFDKKAQKLVAIKHIKLTVLADDIKRSFAKEVEYLKSLYNSDHVIRMYDHENNGRDLFMVLERGDTDLSRYLIDEKKKKNLTPITIKYYWSQMLNAVSEIHALGIIHCDLKPANFLLVCGRLKLIDFGIATSVPDDRTSTFRDNQLGTLSYMSPEAILSQSDSSEQRRITINTKCDVWSLGCILYDMIYGYTPFSSFQTSVSKMYAIVDTSYKIPFPSVNDKNLLNVLKLCLERNPLKRASVSDLLSHPYITHVDKVAESGIDDLVIQLQSLSPGKIKIVRETVKKLSMKK